MEQERIKEWVSGIRKESAAIRRYLHAHPELSFSERETTRYLENKMNEWDIPFTRGPSGTGLIARLDSGSPGPVLAFRADIDALPIGEETGAPYASAVPGVMHACGHDFHMTILLGIARLLSEHRDTLSGSVLFLFQPAEENYPGGASAMVRSGLLEEVRCYFGLHIAPDLPVGTISVRPGPTMASPSTFHITIRGRSGHGAKPQDASDPIVTACQVVLALQTIVSRNLNPLEAAVVSVCRLESGATHNVIPEAAELTGTIRTFSDEVLKRVKERMIGITEGVCRAFESECEIRIEEGYPVVDNQPVPTSLVARAAKEAGYTVTDKEPFMIAEDFSYYIRHRTGCFFHLGTAGSDPASHAALHNARLLPDERALSAGMEILLSVYYLALEEASLLS